MRKFVAACCCAIVGLEVLIAVPLVTCLVVLGLVGGLDVQHVASDLPPAAPTYSPAPLPPPMKATALHGPTIGLPTTLPAPVALTLPACPSPGDCTSSPSPNACLAPAICQAPEATVATLPPPISPQAEVIAELREKVGSPLAESSLAGDAEQTRTDSIAALARVAATDGLVLDTSDPEPHVVAECPANCPAQPTIVQSLQAAADQLYVLAQSLEADGNFGRADHLRGLARDLRREIHAFRHEAGEGPPPGAVKAAAYHEPLPEKPAKISATPVRSAALLPARAELAEPMHEPSLLMTVQPRFFIEEEEESGLGLPIVPENPAP